MDMLELDKNSFFIYIFIITVMLFFGNEKTETKLIIKKPSSNTKFQVLTELKQGVMDCFIEKKVQDLRYRLQWQWLCPRDII